MTSVGDHLAAFNAAVVSGEWAAFAERFAPDAVMTFVGVPAGPFAGRAAIAAAYAANPPTSTMTATAVSPDGPEGSRVRFRWDTGGGTGTMTIRFAGSLVTELSVAFD